MFSIGYWPRKGKQPVVVLGEVSSQLEELSGSIDQSVYTSDTEIDEGGDFPRLKLDGRGIVGGHDRNPA